MILFIGLMALCQLVLSACPDSKPYNYSNTCYLQCPWNPPLVTYLYLNATCVSNCPGPDYFADDASKNCTTICPTQPIITYYDYNRQRCVKNCSSNPSQFAYLTNFTCIDYCIEPTFADDSTRQCVNTCPISRYYQIVGNLRICVQRCYPNYYANISLYCISATSCPSSPAKYYGDDSTNLCVKNCPKSAGTFAQQSTRKCVIFCSLGTFGDPTSMKCVSQCPITPPKYYGSNITRLCHLYCPEGSFADDQVSQCVQICSFGTFGDYSTRKCVKTCPILQNTFADPLTRLCIDVCSPKYFADNNTRSCVPSINCSKREIGDPLTLQCVDHNNCPASFFVDWDLKLCVTVCPTVPSMWANLDTRQCMPYCDWNPPLYVTWKQSQTRRCVTQCPNNPRTFGNNYTQQCVEKCPAGTFGDTSIYTCVKTCPDKFHGDSLSNLCVSDCTTNATSILYFHKPNTSCLSGCPQHYYADNMTLTCVTVCPTSTYAYQLNNTCIQGCPDGLYADKLTQSCVSTCPILTGYYADDSTNMCVKVCPVDPDYYGQDLNDGNPKCVSSCTINGTFTDPLTRTCVQDCNILQGYFGNLTNGRCQLECLGGYGNPYSGQCIDVCPQSPIQTFGDNLTKRCVTKCPNDTYGDKILDVCVIAQNCSYGTFGDDSTNLCVSVCPILKKTFGDPVTKKCVLSCQFGYFAQNATRKCQVTCNVNARTYKDPSTKSCVRNCPSFPDLYNQDSTMSCVPVCSSGYAYAYGNIRKCIGMCPSSPVYFADQQNKKCVTKCANLTYKFVDNSYRGCLKYCPPQVYTVNYTVDLYADNATWTCVSVCTLGYFAFKHPFNSTIRLCVQSCQIVNGTYYFADNVTRSCVTVCPMTKYKTYGDRINFKCVSNCSRKQFRDNATKQCVYRCSNTYYADNTTYNCLKTCPNGTFAEQVNRTCVKYCPKDTYGYNNKCNLACPFGSIYYGDSTTWLCVTKCTTVPDYYSDPNLQLCVENCTGGLFANPYTRKCQVSLNCTNGTVADPTCYRCMPSCSKQPMYFLTNETNLCGQICTNGSFADNSTNICVKICPSPYYGVNSTTNYICVEYCPQDQYKNDGNRMCVSICPQGKFADNLTMSCVSICPDKYYANEANNMCLLSCQPLYASDVNKSCVAICPVNTTASNNSYKCQDQCDYGEYQDNRVCYFGCNNNTYADNLTRKCVKQCPNDPFTYADPVINQCVFNCSSGYYAQDINRTCSLQCPPNQFKQLTLRLCMSPCLEGYFGNPATNSCSLNCLDANYSFADMTTQKCVTMCPQDPDLYGYNNICIIQCPIGFFAQNFTRTCVEICPNISSFYLNASWADNLTRRCVQSCSALSYAFSNISDNLCLNICPDEWFASEITQSCVQECPNNTYAQNSSKQCVYLCPLGQYADTHTKICSIGCYCNQTEYADNSTRKCVSRCPSYPDLYGQNSTNQCVLSCQNGFYAYPISRLCVTNCLAPYFADPITALCVLDCPLHQITYADNQTRSCISSCTNITVGNDTVIMYADISTRRCVAVCPNKPKLYGVNQTNMCQQKCPQGIFGDNDTNLCLEQCIFENPKFTWMEDITNFCVTLCPYEYFADNYTFSCVKNCSVSTFADNSTRRCVFQCPVNPSSYGDVVQRTCVYMCPVNTFADQVTRICLSTCPTTPAYYFHYTPTRKCVKQCLYPYFGELSSQYCVQTCKQGFYGNLTTHKCQLCRTQCVTCRAYLQCLSCAPGFYLFQYQCVISCPTYPIMYFAHLQSLTCFLKCPDPYFGLVSTGLCQLSCPVAYYASTSSRRCVACPVGCITCDSLGCYTCQSLYTFVNLTLTCNKFCNATHIYTYNNKCYSICPDGSYLSNDLVTCLSCSTECATCFSTASNCTRCSTKFYYLGECIDKCPDNFYVDDNLACIACQTNPSKCQLPTLKYTVVPFTEKYKLNAFVVFNRPVNLTIQNFTSFVQIKLNNKTVKSDQFTAIVYNKTTFKITFANSESLNQNALSIGFQPGKIGDQYGNYLTVNQQTQTFSDNTGVTQQIAQTTTSVSAASQYFSWIILAIVLLFLLKGGYPVLITVEAIQLIYMHLFVYIDTMPYLQYKFLDSLKYFHFIPIPNFFPALDGYIDKKYEYFLKNISFLYNLSPLICIFAFCIIVYLIFNILANKSIISNKSVYRFGKSIRKHRLRYSIFNQAFWFTYIYAVFICATQFKYISFDGILNILNILFAVIVFVLCIAYTVFMIYLGYKYRVKDNKIPRKLSFIAPQPWSFPMEIPLRYIRKFIFCMMLLIPHAQSQLVLLIMLNFVFLCYLLCFAPATSALTNAVNIIIQVGYILIESLLFAYNQLVNKNVAQQMGFAIALVVIQGIILVILLLWIFYRFVLVVIQTSCWKKIKNKINQNNDPQYLKEQQRKRDLEYDFGSLERRSDQEQTEDLKQKKFKFQSPQSKQNIFDNSKDNIFQKYESEQDILHSQKGVKILESSLSEDNNLFEPRKTNPDIKKARGKGLLEINQQDRGSDIQEVIIPETKIEKKNLLKKDQQSKSEHRAIWDDIEFDDNEI